VVIQAHAITKVNDTDKDIIQPVRLDYDCCESIGSRQALNDLQLDTPLRSVLTHDNELKLSNELPYLLSDTRNTAGLAHTMKLNAEASPSIPTHHVAISRSTTAQINRLLNLPHKII
jgi:hypothetical protein